jgi:hypothetical protein
VKELKILLKDVKPEDIDAMIESGCLDIVVPEVKLNEKDAILNIIKENNGIYYLSIIQKSGFDENVVDQIVQDFLEKRVCFEPSPGVIKVL